MSVESSRQKCNDAGRKIIEDSEGFRSHVYRCPSGIPTIGFGHTLGVTMQTTPCTMQQADEWMEDDLGQTEEFINEVVSYELTVNQFSALCSLVFNIGVGNFERSSLLHIINSGELEEAPFHIKLWVHDRHGNVLNGLVARRQKEAALWDEPDPEGETIDA